MNVVNTTRSVLSTLLLALTSVGVAQAACQGLPSHAELTTALTSARAAANGGFNLDMWGTIVDRDGVVCAVAMTGGDRGDQWPGSRVISAQKANTANSFSLPGLALSTANLWEATQPGGSLFGLQFSNPVDTAVAYGTGNSTQSAKYGTANDPLVRKQIGGVNVFGGGLALYNSDGTLVGAVGVSGDSSCADHNIAWRTRANLFLDNVPGGVGPNGLDGIDYLPSAAGFGHPVCGGTEQAVAIAISAGA
jgi:uncharacterized protein GlcG (DUF336 family)